MAEQEPAFSIGIEEEYLLVDLETLALAEAPEALMQACTDRLGDQVSPEFLSCQIEIGTKVCANVSEAREDLKRLRRCIAEEAHKHGLAPIAASCHPFSDWRDQKHTDKDRYNTLASDLAGVVQRMLICGMHVHVGIDAPDRRIDLMNQISYFLPHLLALSCSSPFWQGHDTGLGSYRLTVFDNLPRTGLPPHMNSFGEYERSTGILTDLGVIEDSSKIWWDLRPSSKFPTLELRICDVQPSMEDALMLAALTQSLARMLWRLAQRNQRWRTYDSFLLAENRWRAQRYGVTQGLIDFGVGQVVPFEQLVDEMLELIAEDAAHFGSAVEVGRARGIAANGTSADRQRAVYNTAVEGGAAKDAALRAVVSHLVEDFHDGL